MHRVLKFKYYFAISLLLMGAFCIYTLPVTAQNNDAPRLAVMVEALNVRTGPGITYPVIAVLRQDELVEITGRHPVSGWWQVTLANGGSGWVTGLPFYVRVDGDTGNVPKVAVASVSSTTPGSTLPVGQGGGTVVFQTTSGGPIYAINADGTNLRYLTTGLDPALSPDGQWVAFTRWDSPGFAGSGSVWVINVDGSGEKIVLGNIVGHPKSPTWSPDGQQIVFSMQLDDGHPDDLRVCGRKSIPPEAFDIEVVVGKNGEISFCYTLPPKSFWGLRLVDVNTGVFRDLPDDTHAFSPTWDPANPGRLVFAGERGLINVDLNQDTFGPLTEDVLDHSPAFSPDGQRLAVTYLQHDHWEIHGLNADGSGRMRLTETPLINIVEQRLRGEEPRIWNNVAATWSPDGSQIIFLSDRSGQWDIWVMNADGSNQRPMFLPGTLVNINFEYHDVDERMISWGP
ncbi:MAG: PD40 domain-containing protein [Anaerolineae bacterium]|nr:PD40 domain-containing protein [Anaerolineae bacterium]